MFGKAAQSALSHKFAGTDLIKFPKTLTGVGPTLEAHLPGGFTDGDAGPQEVGCLFQAVVTQQFVGG